MLALSSQKQERKQIGEEGLLLVQRLTNTVFSRLRATLSHFTAKLLNVRAKYYNRFRAKNQNLTFPNFTFAHNSR